jgi:hypothetical protein
VQDDTTSIISTVRICEPNILVVEEPRWFKNEQGRATPPIAVLRVVAVVVSNRSANSYGQLGLQGGQYVRDRLEFATNSTQNVHLFHQEKSYKEFPPFLVALPCNGKHSGTKFANSITLLGSIRR